MENEIYRSPYEAYPFLFEAPEELCCDFELLTDEMASLTGLLRAKTVWPEQREELLKVAELIYHANPTLRTHMTVTREETDWLLGRVQAYREEAAAVGFVLPQGKETACAAHVLRVKAKQLVRLLYRYAAQGNEAPPLLFDFCNLLSGYFFSLALFYNRKEQEAELLFISRNYGKESENRN